MKISGFALASLLLLTGAACSEEEPRTGTEGPERPISAPPPPGPRRDAVPPIRSEQDLRSQLGALNPSFEGDVVVQGESGRIQAVAINDPEIIDIAPLSRLPHLALLDLSDCRVEDISALAGLSLTGLALEGTRVTDLSALSGMPLRRLYLARTAVTDLSPVSSSPIEELNLLGTQITDLKPLAKMMRLQMLWLNDTSVRDISPLAGVPLVSLTLAGTQVSDLGPLAGTRLQRLHIARSRVSDLSPLRRMMLTRLVFTPGRINRGLEHARNMASLGEIGTSFGEEGREDDLMPPSAFWKLYDSGAFK